MTFCESSTQPLRSNVLQEAVCHGQPKLQIPFLQWKTKLKRGCKFYACFVEYSFLFPMILKNVKIHPRNAGVIVNLKCGQWNVMSAPAP